MSCNGADRLLQILSHHGIDMLSGIPGGNILPLYDAIHRAGFRHVLARHEQGAAFIAQGIARSTGRLGVCLATSGPGATNLLTGIADAHRDSIPLLAITGQVPRASIGTQAFQEIDIAAMAGSCTKAVFRIGSAAEIDRIVPEAISIALSGRPGPVLLDIPKDVFLERCACDPLPAIRPRMPWDPSRRELDEASIEMDRSCRPLLYVGGGIASAGAQTELRRFAHRRGIPAVSTLLGLGSFAHDDPLFLGMLGMHGCPAANRALEACDLLIVAGARFDDRATGRMDGFAPRARVVHLDADSTEFGRRKPAHATIHGDARRVLELWDGLDSYRAAREWRETIRAMRSDFPMPPQPAHDLFRSIASECPPATIATTDVGQHQMWAAQSWPVDRCRHFLTSGGLGTMGFGLPAAIGAALANPGSPVVCLTGDGSILMNLQELATLADLDLPVKICVLDNGGLGMVRQQQELFFEDRREACGFRRRPDLAAIAHGFGIASARVEDWRRDEAWIGSLHRDGPALIAFEFDLEESVWPMVPPGASNGEAMGPEVLDRIRQPAP
jgi:acetolactate synthase I/II/III large subunit